MIEADVIDREIEQVGAQINRELAGERPLFLGVLNGAFMFVADLLKHITIEGAEISFVKIASYAGLSSTGKVQDLIGLREDIAGRTVVILEDMIDSGESIMHMKKILEDYNNEAKKIWENQQASVIVKRLEEFKGISHKKASLGTLILIRDLGVDIEDKQNIDIAYDVHIRRIFLRMGLVEKDTQENIINKAKQINPRFPGELTTSFWAIGRKYCFANNPSCEACPLNHYCREYKLKTTMKVGA